MNKDKTMLINGFKAELLFHDDTSSVFISKGNCSSSLTLVEDLCRIENDDGDEIPVDDRTIRAIRDWADKHGY